MKRETAGQLLFFGATASALALYGLTAPVGLPWNYSSHLALAYLGEIVRLPAMPRPIWGFYVQVFGGSVALSATLASVAAGLIGAIVNRYFGWRFAAAAALLWIFLPPVWNRAITGEYTAVLASLAVAAFWGLNAVGLWVTRKARIWHKAWLKTSGGLIEAALPVEAAGEKRRRVKRIAGWIVLGATGAFALLSLKFHDYRLGEAAGVFARGVVASARGRILVMNGLCDDQIARCSRVESVESVKSVDSARATISLRNDDAYRANLLDWVRRAFPAETNLWVSAEVSPRAFVTAAAQAHPEMFHLMNGTSTTPDAWERRWREFQPYLDSSDPFVPTARRLFACEGNAVGNALVDAAVTLERDPPADAAWRLYKRIYEEVDPGNVSALVNMNEMIRRGYPASGSEKLLIEKRLAHFFENRDQRRRAPEAMTLAEWHNEMIVLMNRGETEKAGRLARLILSNPKWRGYIPANAVMGGVMARAGDYVASEAFYRTATATTNRIPARVLNGYADTLLHRGNLDEAEKMARRAVAETDDEFWMARLTLAEVLYAHFGEMRPRDEPRGESVLPEIRALLKTVPPDAPQPLREEVRKILREISR